MKKICTFCFVLLCAHAHAQFSGAYKPANWTTTLYTVSNGSVDASGAPTSIVITGSNAATVTNNVDIDYTITAIASGVFSFNWAYHTNDSYNDPQYDLTYVLINGSATALSSAVGGIDQSGTFSASANAGDVIGFRVRAVDNVEGNATLSISSFSPPGGVLPVKLTGFTADKQATSVLLRWTTASETDFSHFIIQRSADGSSFANLKTITAGAPNGEYNYTDQHPLPSTGYYRLRMVDDNLQYSFSKTIAVHQNNNASATASLSPNPASNLLTLRLNSTVAGAERISIVNAAGAVIKEEVWNLAVGLNTKSLNIHTLANGVYFLGIKSSGLTIRFVKQ